MRRRLKIKLGNWLTKKAPESDIAISTRVRLARNLRDLPFPIRSNRTGLNGVVSIVKETVKSNSELKKLAFFGLEELSDLEKRLLVEEHLVSPAFSQVAEGYAVVLSENEEISIMVNEEDHLRIQTLLPGLQLWNAWELANKLDDYIGSKLQYAFSEKLGYLTGCPTNMGTGMRASVMLHLPVLFMIECPERFSRSLVKQGIAVRGLFGEGTFAIGNLYQISNQVTLGKTEEELIKELDKVCNMMIERERKARKNLLEKNRIELEDRIERALGILGHAWLISFEEALGLISMVRLGIELDLAQKIDKTAINNLITTIGSAHLQNVSKEKLSHKEINLKRAQMIREKLSL